MWTKGHYRKDCPKSAGTIPDQDQNIQPYIPSTYFTQMMTAPYAVPQSSLVTISKKLAMTKLTNQSHKKTIQRMQPALTVPLQTTKLTKPITTTKVTPVKTNPVGKKMVRYATTHTSRPTMRYSANTNKITSVQKPTPVVANINIQDNECVVVSTDKNEAPLTEDEILNLFQDTSSEEELDDEYFSLVYRHYRLKPNVFKHLSVSCRFKFPVMVVITYAIALYDTGANVTCMSLMCYTKLKRSTTFARDTGLVCTSSNGTGFKSCGINTLCNSIR